MTKQVLLRQLKISWIPLTLALSYASVAYFSAETDKRSLMTFVNYFSGTFFFSMWIVGQYLRTKKEINDNSNFTNLQTGITDLHQAIAKLQQLSFKTNQFNVSTENKLLKHATQAVENGFVLAGLLQAGVAYEQAILLKAERLNIDREKNVTVSQTLNQLKEYYDRGTIAEFYAVWKLRNQLVHLTDEAAQELEQSPQLIKYFEWAINELDRE